MTTEERTAIARHLPLLREGVEGLAVDLARQASRRVIEQDVRDLRDSTAWLATKLEELREGRT